MRPFLIVALSAACLSACSGPDEHNHPSLISGEQLFNHDTLQYLQEEGEGAFLRGVPPVKYTTMTYRQMVDHIRGQGRGDDSRMPTFSSMSKAEAESISIYVRGQLTLR